MAVLIDSGPISATDRLQDVPTEKWRELMIARRLHMKTKLAYDCRCLVEFVDDAKAMFSTLGFKNVETMIREGYQLIPEEIAIAVEWLKLNPPNEPLPIDEVKKLTQREIGIKGGKAGPGRGHKTDDNINRFKGGTSRYYVIARLNRDRPDLANKVLAGKMSANAAAIKAGFRKKQKHTCPKCGHEWRG